ncbi:hypothetical protein [Streptomyces chrestomyceticus]|uniref:hypothetical protein n=1 Tax=Streptomyces chrestomyceticus TaxID=68185 RepID=UPI0033F2E74A
MTNRYRGHRGTSRLKRSSSYRPHKHTTLKAQPPSLEAPPPIAPDKPAAEHP